MRKLFLVVVCCLFVVIALPALAAEAEAVKDEGGADLNNPGSSATCTATCTQMGGSVTVSCSGTCTATDQSCWGERGFAKCDDGSQIKYCQACNRCSAFTDCPEGGYASCSGWGDPWECIGGNGLCFASCPGQISFCPGHEGEFLCTAF